jgi:hypothetical protein
MQNNMLRVFLLAAGTATFAVPLSLPASNFPKTASCPIDNGTAHATGKTRKAMQAACIDVEYKHKGTDYSNPRHPQKFNHLFWITHCSE